jgi:hypothetical protein
MTGYPAGGSGGNQAEMMDGPGAAPLYLTEYGEVSLGLTTAEDQKLYCADVAAIRCNFGSQVRQFVICKECRPKILKKLQEAKANQTPMAKVLSDLGLS